ncbi:MAG: hypothetical protein V3T77_09640, partial [Planctomycetota bacterium]
MMARHWLLLVVWLPVELLCAQEKPEALLEQALLTYQEALEETQRDLRLARFRRSERIFAHLVE